MPLNLGSRQNLLFYTFSCSGHSCGSPGHLPHLSLMAFSSVSSSFQTAVLSISPRNAGPLCTMNQGSQTQEYHPLDLGVAATLPSVVRLTEAQPMREHGWCPADGDLSNWCQSLYFIQEQVHMHGGKALKHNTEESR